ncbi:hypothetical protein ACIPSE_09975 [Streptomyces sp. NPDC090106]|uniref:hypothetical protein n=1 Tax=Streptomyces sp. NPDC090106 TaxID=3365946 RepID=UPI003811884C
MPFIPVPPARTDAGAVHRAAVHPGGGRAVEPGSRVADVLRIVSDSRTSVFSTVSAGGRVRYGYWRPVDSATGRGGCYVALPTDVCEELRASGRLLLGDPVVDPAKTTYRVRLAPATGRVRRLGLGGRAAA